MKKFAFICIAIVAILASCNCKEKYCMTCKIYEDSSMDSLKSQEYVCHKKAEYMAGYRFGVYESADNSGEYANCIDHGYGCTD